MNLRVLLFFYLIVIIGLAMTPFALAADDDDEEDDESEDPWGDAKIDHELNKGWDYPDVYIEQPLNYSKRVTEFAFGFSQKYTRHYYDEVGDLVAGSFKTKKQIFSFYFGMGFTDNWSVSIMFPFVYKKTKIFDGNQNYRQKRDNTYGYLFEEGLVDFFDNHEIWKLWEADLPQLGDVVIHNSYSVFRKMEPYTTSIVLELDIKFPTGNDNPRRGDTVRNYLTAGNTDSALGIGIKQQAWWLSFEFHFAYNIRWPAATKHSAGELDYGDQLLGEFELAFQPDSGWSYLDSLVLAGAVHAMARPLSEDFRFAGKKAFSTYLKDNAGNITELDDAPGGVLSVEPKIIYMAPVTWLTHLFNEVHLGMDIPVYGQRSFLVSSKSNYLPPWDIEGYEGVGITYSFNLIKRWQ